MCSNPMQKKANNIRSMAMDMYSDFEAAAASQRRKALVKLRGEAVRLYGMQQELAAAAQTSKEKALTDALLADLEQITNKAHNSIGFVPVPLDQLEHLAQL